jgi:type IV secretion system protein VirB11
LLDAWSTGHPGGIATFHATTPLGALRRLDRLAQRNNVPPQPHLVADAVDVVVMLDKVHGTRCVTDVVRVLGLDTHQRYQLQSVLEASDGSLHPEDVT